MIHALFALVGEQVATGFGDLSTQAVAGIKEVENWLATGPLQLTSTQLSSYVTEFHNWLSTNKATILTSVLGLGTSATHVLEGFFIALFSIFFFLSSGHRIWAWLLRILPRAAREPTDDAARSGWVTLSHYVRATFIVAAVDGGGIGIGSALLGVPLALPLGVVVFFGAFIPAGTDRRDEDSRTAALRHRQVTAAWRTGMWSAAALERGPAAAHLPGSNSRC